MRKNNKSTYLILALISLIIFNLGSAAIQLSRSNIQSFDLKKIKIKDLVLEVFNLAPENRTNILRKNGEIIDEEDEGTGYIKDFIIIDRIEEYEDLIIVRDSTGKGSIENIPEPLNISKIGFDREKPYIFLYHTHATEGYGPFEDNSYYTTDNSKNVVNIGNTISKVLEAKGHKVRHETMHHDRPSFNQSYSRSLNTLKKVKGEEQNLRFFFDIHRDGIERESPYYESFRAKSKIKIDGVDVATFSMVIGPNTPNYDQVLAFAKYIKVVSDSLYPGLCKGIIIKPIGKYNLFISDYASLMEIGSNLNTVSEANECGKLVGEILDIVIRSIEE